MDNNLGNAMKYLLRLNEKDTPLKNASKALWYVKDAIANCPFWSGRPENQTVIGHHAALKMAMVLDAEPDDLVRDSIRSLWLACHHRLRINAIEAADSIGRLVNRLQHAEEQKEAA